MRNMEIKYPRPGVSSKRNSLNKYLFLIELIFKFNQWDWNSMPQGVKFLFCVTRGEFTLDKSWYGHWNFVLDWMG